MVKLYNEKTPDECPAVEKLSPKRRKKATEYLRVFPDQGFWLETFQQIERSPFLRGLTGGNGHRFIADFDWLLAAGKDGTENCVKVREGKYSNGR